MKKFKFKYENILKLRLDYENDVKNKLKKLNQTLHQLESDKASAEHAYKVYQKQVEEELQNGLKGYQMQRINAFQSFYRKQIEELEQEIIYVEQQIEAVKAELMEAIKERKIMEKIKEKDYKSYLDEINVMEAKATDEVVNFQNSRRSGG